MSQAACRRRYESVREVCVVVSWLQVSDTGMVLMVEGARMLER